MGNCSHSPSLIGECGKKGPLNGIITTKSGDFHHEPSRQLKQNHSKKKDDAERTTVYLF